MLILTYVDETKVLLVDDDSDVIITIAKSLRKYGIKVTGYSDPRQAVSQFKPKTYDFILLDVSMPGLTGFDVAKQVWDKDPDARICFFSAFDIYEKEAQVVFKDIKTVFFVKKPIGTAELARFIKDHLHMLVAKS